MIKNALCTAALLAELKPAPWFMSAIIGQAWLIQVCLIIVAMTTEVRHTCTSICPIMADGKQGAGLSSGSSAAVHKVNCWGHTDPEVQTKRIGNVLLLWYYAIVETGLASLVEWRVFLLPFLQ